MKNIIMESIERFKKIENPIYVWGGYPVSVRTTKFYRKQGVNIKGNLIGKKYFKRGEVIDGTEVRCLEEVLDTTDFPINLIVGYGSDSKFEINMLDDEKIESLFFADFSTAFVLGHEDINIFDDDFWRANKSILYDFRCMLKDQKSIADFDEWVFQKRTSYKWKGLYTSDTYFENDIIELKNDEVFVDCGSFHGETVNEFINIMETSGKRIKKIVAVEPDIDNYKYIIENLNVPVQVEVINKGVWSNKGELRFSLQLESNSAMSETGDFIVPVDTIDNLLADEVATFIKMDVEGSELEALKGAEKQIRNNRPKLAICIYHKKYDIINIPKYLKSLVPDYNFYFRNHSTMATDSVLYAI